MYLIKSGDLKGLVSLNLGSQIVNPQYKKPERKNSKKYQNKEKLMFDEIDVRKF